MGFHGNRPADWLVRELGRRFAMHITSLDHSCRDGRKEGP
jgi:hypothetical protein